MKALIILDFINEIIHPDGKLAGKGYAKFEQEFSILNNAVNEINSARKNGDLIIHIRVGFSPSYIEHPEHSPLFGAAKQYKALCLGEWGTEFHSKVTPKEDDVILTKHRVSGFYGTELDSILRCNKVTEVSIMGVATDMAVQATARDAHDRDYAVSILANCCAATNKTEHDSAILLLSKVAGICPPLT